MGDKGQRVLFELVNYVPEARETDLRARAEELMREEVEGAPD